MHRQHIEAAHGAAAGYYHAVAHAHAYAAYQDAGQPVVEYRRGGNGYEGGGQREHRGKGEGAQEEAAPEALVGYYEYGYAENIVQYTCKVDIAEVYAEILRQHGPQKLGIAHKAGSVEVPRRGKYVYAYGHYDAAQGGYKHTSGKGAHGAVVHKGFPPGFGLFFGARPNEQGTL